MNDLEKLEGQLLNLPQVECPLVHKFANGVYYREIHMPAGAFIIGQQHKTEHFNIILSGRASVLIDGVVQQIKAPDSFISGVGVRKVLFIHEDMRWVTIHPTDITDVDKLEALLVEKSETFKKHELEKLQCHLLQ